MLSKSIIEERCYPKRNTAHDLTRPPAIAFIQRVYLEWLDIVHLNDVPTGEIPLSAGVT
jgi:hypothetical protein